MSHEVKHEPPPHGGSFIRQPDGSLKPNVEHHHRAPQHETPAEEKPAKPHAARKGR